MNIVLQDEATVSIMFQDGLAPGEALGINFRGTSSALDVSASSSESEFLSLSGAKVYSHASTVLALQVTSSAASDCKPRPHRHRTRTRVRNYFPTGQPRLGREADWLAPDRVLGVARRANIPSVL